MRQCAKEGCKAAPLRVGEFCLMHSPAHAEQVAAARSRRRPKELEEIKSPADAQAFLAKAVALVAAGKMSVSKLDKLRATINTMWSLDVMERKTDAERAAREAVSDRLAEDWAQKAMARHLDPEKCQEYIDNGVLTAEEVAEGQRLDAEENRRHEELQFRDLTPLAKAIIEDQLEWQRRDRARQQQAMPPAAAKPIEPRVNLNRQPCLRSHLSARLIRPHRMCSKNASGKNEQG